MGDLKEATAIDSGGVVSSLAPKKFTGDFAFPAFPLTNNVVDDFKK